MRILDIVCRDSEALRNFLLRQWKTRRRHLPLECYRGLIHSPAILGIGYSTSPLEGPLSPAIQRWLDVAKSRDISRVPDPITNFPTVSTLPPIAPDPQKTVYLYSSGRLSREPDWTQVENLIYAGQERPTFGHLPWLTFRNVRKLKRVELPFEGWDIFNNNCWFYDWKIQLTEFFRPVLSLCHRWIWKRIDPDWYKWTEGSERVLVMTGESYIDMVLYTPLMMTFDIDYLTHSDTFPPLIGTYIFCSYLGLTRNKRVRLGLWMTQLHRWPLSEALYECVSGEYTERTFRRVMEYIGVPESNIERLLHSVAGLNLEMSLDAIMWKVSKL